MSKGIPDIFQGRALCPFLLNCGSCCCVKEMSLFEAGIVSFYYWDKTDRMIFGVFGEAIDKFDVRVEGNRFAL